ncbi:MAG: aminopeptidase P family protein [Alphaproteobacteria bacterium]|nr:aminopeptidase P family protein [Alphaproteobacteria bacterium]
MTTIAEIQKQLTASNFDGYIVTRNNLFLGQDILSEENKIYSLTGFDGSSGNLIIFRNHAVLLVDGRYDLQARQQTDANIIKVECTKESIGTWIQNNIESPSKFLYNSWCHSISEVDFWKRSFSQHNFVDDKAELLGERVTKSDSDIFELEEQFCGISSEEKLSYFTKFINDNKLDAYLICECDCVSWLLNLRSNLIKNTPIIRAFALISSQGEVSLFVNDFSTLADELENFKGKTIGIAYNRTPKKIQFIMKDKHIWLNNLNNPITDWKSQKNAVEISGIKNAHIRDGLAVCKFLHWLENNNETIDELGVVNKLYEYRKQGKNFYSDSFETIAGFGSNGAIIHYHPTKQTNKQLIGNSLLLLDSGAQYFDGTTDITRTIAINTPTNEMKQNYTQVLKAHIAVASAIFPQNTAGNVLDTLARAKLWTLGQEYAHGTGHGVGHFSNVHEGPQSLSQKNNVSLKKDMIVSIEPGFYLENKYGIRLENLALIEEASTLYSENMLSFTPLTVVPFDKRLINKEMMNESEISWLNNYHKFVFETLSPLCDEDLKKWLYEATANI